MHCGAAELQWPESKMVQSSQVSASLSVLLSLSLLSLICATSSIIIPVCLGLFFLNRAFIRALFPENLNAEKKGRPTTAGSKIKVRWTVRCVCVWVVEREVAREMSSEYLKEYTTFTNISHISGVCVITREKKFDTFRRTEKRTHSHFIRSSRTLDT